MNRHTQLKNNEASKVVGSEMNTPERPGKGVFAYIVAPILRLHRYRNARDRILDEALTRRYCQD